MAYSYKKKRTAWEWFVYEFRRTPIPAIILLILVVIGGWVLVHYFHAIAVVFTHPIRNLFILFGIAIAIFLWKNLYWSNVFRLFRGSSSHRSKRSGGQTRSSGSPREIYLTLLLIVGIFLASLSLLYDFSAVENAFCFVGIALSFFIIEAATASGSSSSLLISYDVKFNARLKNRGTATVSLTFQWPEKNDSRHVRERIRIRASAAIAERFSHLSQAPSYGSLRNNIFRAIRRDTESLGLGRVSIFIHDIEVKGGRDTAVSGIIIGGS